MNRLNTTITGLLLLTILGLMGCFSKEEIPDVSNITVALDRVDYDDAFLSLKGDANLNSELEILKSEYPNLTNIYVENVMQFKRPRDTSDVHLTEIEGFRFTSTTSLKDLFLGSIT